MSVFIGYIEYNFLLYKEIKMSRIKNTAIILLVSSLFLVFVPACQNMLLPPAKAPQDQQKPIDVSRFADIPVPAGFKLDTEKSFVFENPSMRAGVLIYTGSGKLTPLSAFYRENMPLNGWKFVSGFEMKEAVLNFQKEGWNCVVNIREDYSTKITINVGPTETHPQIKESEKGFKEFK